MIKIIIGVIVGVLFADTIKHLAIKVYDWVKEKLQK